MPRAELLSGPVILQPVPVPAWCAPTALAQQKEHFHLDPDAFASLPLKLEEHTDRSSRTHPARPQSHPSATSTKLGNTQSCLNPTEQRAYKCLQPRTVFLNTDTDLVTMCLKKKSPVSKTVLHFEPPPG